MEQSEVIHLEHHENKNEVRNVTIVLSVLTLVELALGFLMMKMDHGSTARLATKIVIIVLMLAKAYYIVGYFMHLKHEIRNLIMTIVVPLALFVWFITAFLYDGNSFRNLRNTHDAYYKEHSQEKAVKKEHGTEQHKEGTETEVEKPAVHQ
jgi:cytochrome c oxidase subunit IV